MSNKERILQLIDGVADNRLAFVVGLLESLKAYAGEDVEPDQWDLQMLAEAEKENDGTTITLNELKKELGFGIQN